MTFRAIAAANPYTNEDRGDRRGLRGQSRIMTLAMT